MRILFRCGAFLPQIGGLEVLSGQFVEAMHGRGHEVLVLAANAPKALPADSWYRGVRVLRFPFIEVVRGRDLAQFGKLVEECTAIQAEFKPDIVHLNLTGPDAIFFLYALAGVPCIAVLHSPIDDPAPRSLFGPVLVKADWVVGISRSMLKDMTTFWPPIGSRSSVIHNALMPPALPPGELPFEPPTLLCIGRVVRDKGFDVAVAAFSQIHRRHPSARLIVAGNGPEMKPLQRLAAELGVSESIEFPGWVHPEDVPELINRATAVLMPGRWREPFGLVALQAAQMGRPLVTTPLGGIPEIGIDGETFILVEPENADALAAAVDKLLADPDQARRIGAQARAHINEHFSFELFLDRYEQLYRRVIETRRTARASA